MADKPQVVKLAQPGIDVKTAGDENLVYNSNWPLLKIYKQGSFTVPDLLQNSTIVTHDLGFVPFYWFFTNNSINDWNPAGPVSGAQRRAEFFGAIGGGEGTIAADTNKLFYKAGSGPSVGGTVKIYYYMFALDITTTYKAPSIRSGGVVGPRNLGTLFKLAKDGKNISSHNLEDYVVHSNGRSPMLHSVNPGVTTPDPVLTNQSSFIFYHNLGYIPLAFGYIQGSDGSYSVMPFGSTGDSNFNVDEQKVNYHFVANGEVVTIILLKDPFDIDYVVNVSV